MSSENKRDESFDSEKFLRRLERERRLKEIEQSFNNIAEEAQKKQDDIYSNVFTEKGQEETLASHSNMEINTNLQSPNIEDSKDKGVFSRVVGMISPNREKEAHMQTIELSPTGVSSFPETEPVRVSKKGRNAFWDKDGPGIGSRMTNATVQDTIIHTFFTVRANSKKIIIGILLFCFIILLSVTLVDIKKSSQSRVLSEEGWRKLEEIKTILVDKNVEKKKLDDKKSHHFDAIFWLAEEATTYTDMFVKDRRLLMERFVLLVLYYSTRVEGPWENEYDWLTKKKSICDWRKVVCENVAGVDEDRVDAVVEINLSSNKLSGTIIDEISKLTHLKILKLSNNRLTGNVPASFGQLKSLEILEVGENLLTGEMPTSVCDLEDFEKLTVIATDCSGYWCRCCNTCA